MTEIQAYKIIYRIICKI